MGSNKKWFAPKVYGYGYVPISWEGFLILLVLVVVVVLSFYVFFGMQDGEPTLLLVGGYIVFVLILSFLPIAFLKKRFAAKLRWRWGVKDIDRE